MLEPVRPSPAPASTASSKAARRFAQAKPHQWVSFEDPDEERTWVFDVTFFTSAWKCIYGAGCPGIDEERAPEKAIGCCSHGAHMTGKADTSKVKKYAEKLSDSQWQYRGHALRAGSIPKGTLVKDEDTGDTVTRVVDGACIFLNRPGWAGGPGCAFHQAALDAGDEPLTWKPEVCWQVPFRREDHTQPDDHVLSLIGQWDRMHWGEGGHDFGWWCTEEAEAFASPVPVYLHSKAELIELTSKAAYEMLAAYLDGITDGAVATDVPGPNGSTPAGSEHGGPTLLPHPVVRKKG